MDKNLYIDNCIKKINRKQNQINKINELIQSYVSNVEDVWVKTLEKYSLSIEDSNNFKSYITNLYPCINNSKEPNIIYNTLIKELFKQLMLKVHPDKQTSYSSDKSCQEVQSAFDEQDIYKLICMAQRIGILNYNDIDTNLITLILEQKKYKLDKQIEQQKNTIIYKYIVCEDFTCIDMYMQSVKLHKFNEYPQ
jgi:hypothetical protein